MLGGMFGNAPENETAEDLCQKIKARYNIALALISDKNNAFNLDKKKYEKFVGLDKIENKPSEDPLTTAAKHNPN